jgi:hypothetical protein
MCFIDGRLNTKLVCSIMDMPCDSASNHALNGSTRWITGRIG